MFKRSLILLLLLFHVCVSTVCYITQSEGFNHLQLYNQAQKHHESSRCNFTVVIDTASRKVGHFKRDDNGILFNQNCLQSKTYNILDKRNDLRNIHDRVSSKLTEDELDYLYNECQQRRNVTLEKKKISINQGIFEFMIDIWNDLGIFPSLYYIPYKDGLADLRQFLCSQSCIFHERDEWDIKLSTTYTMIGGLAVLGFILSLFGNEPQNEPQNEPKNENQNENQNENSCKSSDDDESDDGDDSDSD